MNLLPNKFDPLTGLIRYLRDTATPRQWTSETLHDGGIEWIVMRGPGCELGASGWKCHVSLDPRDIAEVLPVLWPHLIQGDSTFKIASNLESLVLLNNGAAGVTQIGKAITIYCRQRDHAEHLAMKIDDTLGMTRAALVMGELTPRPGSAASIRFGSFLPVFNFDEFGRPQRMIADDSGALAEDTLSLSCSAASSSALQCRSFRHWGPKDRIACAGRLLAPIVKVKSYPREVYKAIDVETGEEFIVKRSWNGTFIDIRGNGTDKRERLKSELETLMRLAALSFPACPPLGLVEGQGWSALVTRVASGIPISQCRKEDIGHVISKLAGLLEKLHEAEVAHRDLKPSNVFLSESNVHLIDFEISASFGSNAAPWLGTRNYMAPEGWNGAATRAVDIFAFGGIVASLYLGQDIAYLPKIGQPVLAMMQRMGTPATVVAMVAQCWDDDPSLRPTWVEVRRILNALDKREMANDNVICPAIPMPTRETIATFGGMTRAFQISTSAGISYKNNHMYPAHQLEGINLGAAGVMIGLATLDEACRTDFYSEDIKTAAAQLAHSSIPQRSAGLFTGNAGVALALGVAAMRCNEPKWLSAMKSRFAAAVASVSEYDLFSGMAGILLSGVMLSRVTRDPWALDLTIPVAEKIIGSLGCYHGVIGIAASGRLDGISGCYTGAAHGSAGIALALSQFADATDDSATSQLARTIFDSILRHARFGDDGRMMRIAGRPDLLAPPLAWCHGPLGIVWCMLQTAGICDEMPNAVDWCFNALSKAIASGNPTYCHGLSGALEVFRMFSAVPRYQRQAGEAIDKIAGLIWEQRQLDNDGRTVWGAEDPNKITPDLFVGSLAPATALAMASVNVSMPVLGADWLIRCATPLTSHE